ncbi:MAG: hypothetical protein FJY85_20930 [Deltaproteobacteria bacterium]|nr:hypothetical protein [Deltaproteobacteria bacterium]
MPSKPPSAAAIEGRLEDAAMAFLRDAISLLTPEHVLRMSLLTDFPIGASGRVRKHKWHAEDPAAIARDLIARDLAIYRWLSSCY